MAPLKQILRKWKETEKEQNESNAESSAVETNAAAAERESLLNDEENWSDIRHFFSEEKWRELPELERLQCRNMKNRYEYMLLNSVPMTKPFFMVEASNQTLNRQEMGRNPTNGALLPVSLSTGTSSRIEERRSYREVSPINSIPERQHPESPICSNPNPDHSEGQNGSALSISRGRGGRIPDKVGSKKIRTFDKMVYGLPNFGEKSKKELNKARMNMKMHYIHQDCKEHIRRMTDGDEYLSRKEWADYAKEICDAYPNLKTGGDQYWVSFKIGLQKSFSAERKTKKKKQTVPEAETFSEDESTSPTSRKHPLDSEAEAAAMGLRSQKTDRAAIKSLISKSLRFRKVERTTLTAQELLQAYPYLKMPEMMIYDYLNTIQVSVEECERIFSKNMALLQTHYQISAECENDKLDIMMRVHEFFVSKAVKRGLKAVFIVKEEERHSLHEMESSDIQAPFIVVLRKQDFVTGTHQVRSASLLMANNLVSTLQQPCVDKVMLLLLAAYVTLNVEYPSPYQQFMRALEKLLTGKAQPSKYGRSQVQYDRLMSLISK